MEQRKIQVTLKDGSIKEIQRGTRVMALAESLSQGLAKAAVAAVVDGKQVDLSAQLEQDCSVQILTFDSEDGREIFRHTASHILAQAVKRLYPGAKLAIGPAIENGFYYDFDLDTAFSSDILGNIEAEMGRIVSEDLPVERFTMPREEAVRILMENEEPYKVELVRDLPEDAVISFYRQGEYMDMCTGPHLPSTGRVKAFKLLQVAGAYWRGSEKNKMLQRIYGTAFPKKAELEAHLEALEEAKKRDHIKLGRELELFMTSDVVGQGLPLLMPKGARVIQLLQRFVEDEEARRGYQLTKTPIMAKSDLYRLSGHWQHYKDKMFLVGAEPEDAETEDKGTQTANSAADPVMALRPMTCPFQFQIYNSRVHSYRDLPVRYSETSTLFRKEASGEMHGLIRVRQFTISEGHLIVTPEQLESEFKGVLDLIHYMMTSLGIQSDIWYRFSKWDPANKEKYIGTPETWEDVQGKMKDILDHLGIPYREADGEAAFYGPKLDIQFKNVHGKEDTIITVQIDFALAERLGMTYVDKDNEKKPPYVIHRTSIGCYERTLAMLIEKYAGAFPAWIAPVQVKILPISDRHLEYAKRVADSLSAEGFRTEMDDREEKIGRKIRDAQMEKVPYMLVTGDKEAGSGTVAVRSRKAGDMGVMNLEAFMQLLAGEVAQKSNSA
ncbi:MAG TPA: threonine--tRNA ligase [Clostridiales bacterium]|nr:threonine--tRNA ligase [Clostridiales bacterium]